MTGPTSIGAHMSIPGFKPHGITNVHVNHTGPRSSFALAVAGAVLAGAFALTACAPAATPTAADPTTASEPAPPASEAGAAGTQPAGGAASVLALESDVVLAWQDRWYDNFCSSAVIALGDENCIGIALEGVEQARTAPERIEAEVPSGMLGDELRAAAAEVAAAGEAFLAASCDTVPTECVAETDDLTDAVRMYGDVVAEVVAAS